MKRYASGICRIYIRNAWCINTGCMRVTLNNTSAGRCQCLAWNDMFFAYEIYLYIQECSIIWLVPQVWSLSIRFVSAHWEIMHAIRKWERDVINITRGFYNKVSVAPNEMLSTFIHGKCINFVYSGGGGRGWWLYDRDGKASTRARKQHIIGCRKTSLW